MTETPKLPAVWVMGLTNTTFGLFGGFAVITLAEMLAAQGVSGGRIAATVAAVLSPGFWAFGLAPLLDVRFSRRTYALVFSMLGALALALTVALRSNLALVEGLMVFGYFAASMVQGAVGGWMGSLIDKGQQSHLGAWFTIANLGGAGVMILVASALMARFSAPTAGALLASLVMLPSLLYFWIPAPGPDRRAARESFGRLFVEVLALLRRREVLVALLLFTLPSASFALANVLGGLGKDFSATERMVSLVGGIGVVLAGVGGSLLLPPLARHFRLRPLYLGIGIGGGLFTASLLLLPHTPWVFAIALTGENLCQALAFAAGNAITFETIGRNNPLAATQFTLLISATNLPIILMGFVDGRAYSWRGVPGALMTDAAISIVVCLVLAWVLPWINRRGKVAELALVGPPGFEPGTKAL